MKLLKRMSVAGAVFALGSTIAMGAVQLDSRFDLVRSDKDSDVLTTPQANETYFKTSRARVKFNGKLKDDVTFMARLRFDLTEATEIDGSSNVLELASVTKKVNDQFSFSMGKIIPVALGVIGTYSPGDVYFYPSTGALVYGSGLGLTYKLGDHVLEGAFFNADAADKSTNMGESLKFTANLDMLKVILNYASLNKADAATTSRVDTYMAAGLQATVGEYIIDLDYIQKVEADKTTKDKDDTTTSMVAKVEYAGANFRPHIKVASDKLEVSDTDYATKMTYGLALEYYPEKESNFRYHLAYVSDTTEYETDAIATAAGLKAGKKERTEQTIYAGIRLAADFI